MSFVQFWRIVSARKWFILGAAFFCIAGAYGFTLVVPPRWDAHARVLLNLLKPDPVTGQIIMGPGTNTYVASQIQLVQDYSVAGLAVDRLGFLTDPGLVAQYHARSSGDRRDFRRWLAQSILDGTDVEVVAGSNVLEITYSAQSPDTAQTVVEAMRRAYLDMSLFLRRFEANRNADWFASQTQKAKAALDDAEKAEADYELANNVYMATDTMDVDSARLAALATQGVGQSQPATGTSSASVQLAETEAQIAELGQTLGPIIRSCEHCGQKERSLGEILHQEHAGKRGVRDPGSALDAQAAIVGAKYEKLARLRQLQADVDMRRDMYNKTAAKAADLRQQATVNDTGLTPLGPAFVPAKPGFPNMPLIVIGSAGLGLSMGFLMALLFELLYRRVRGYEDLQSAVDAPVLAVVIPPPNAVY